MTSGKHTNKRALDARQALVVSGLCIETNRDCPGRLCVALAGQLSSAAACRDERVASQVTYAGSGAIGSRESPNLHAVYDSARDGHLFIGHKVLTSTFSTEE